MTTRTTKQVLAEMVQISKEKITMFDNEIEAELSSIQWCWVSAHLFESSRSSWLNGAEGHKNKLKEFYRLKKSNIDDYNVMNSIYQLLLHSSTGFDSLDEKWNDFQKTIPKE